MSLKISYGQMSVYALNRTQQNVTKLYEFQESALDKEQQHLDELNKKLKGCEETIEDAQAQKEQKIEEYSLFTLNNYIKNYINKLNQNSSSNKIGG